MEIARGYSGYYNGQYLRSSLEFAYAYYLDHKGIEWKYESNLYTFDDGSTYLPDFYVKKDNSFKIVEVKGDGNKESGLKKAKKLKESHDLDVEMIFYKDLVCIYKNEMPIRLANAKRIWIEQYGAERKHNTSGELNPMFGNKHSEKTVKLISQKAKERFSSGKYDYVTQHMIQSNRDCNFDFLRKPRSPRVTKNCINRNCNKEFVVTIYSPRVYCSHLCANRAHSLLGAEKEKEEAFKIRENIRAHMLLWARSNKDIIKNTKFNKIAQPLQPLYDSIESEFGIKDKRIVSKALLRKDGTRKEMLTFLKEYTENL